ncbi:DMT family transporter [Alteromonas sp. a30]|uniref:DMT family transporter n=1 Tax=Alteromonas sp. a30 TaxID=2730917 RepID=UPI00227E944D|nr:DMT family transporter [Alteromonas sp. a30]MCY7294999.1 DMT family transporter [Alteromonas sp. a30]
MQVKWLAELFFLAAIWGASFIFIRISIPEMGVFGVTFFRTAIAALFLGIILYATNKANIRKIFRYWGTLSLIALCGTAIPFSLWGFVSQFLASGTMAVLNAATPLFGTFVAYMWLKEPFHSNTIIGLILGFIGVCVMMLVPQEGIQLDTLAICLGLLASACYGLSANITRAKAAGLSAMTVATGSQLYSTLFIAPIAIYFMPETVPGFDALISASVLGIVCTGYALYKYFQMIAEQGISKTLSVTYLIPLFAMLWGALFLGEPIEARTLLGGACILLGVAFTTGYFSFRRRAKRA